MTRYLHNIKIIMVFIFETWRNEVQAARRIRKLSLKNLIVAPAQGTTSGLWFLWDNMVCVHELKRYFYYLLVQVRDQTVDWGVGF
jgi:hypothetical protein